MTELYKLRGLRASDLARLAAWKMSQGARALADRNGGTHLLLHTAQRWSNRWLKEYGTTGVQTWLARPNAGAFWFDPPEPRCWAAATCTDTDVELARKVDEGVFDLLGSGPVPLGPVPAWRTDLYSRAEWPLEPASRLKLLRHDGSDIRTVWELSRCYHFLALARAWATTGDSAYPRTFARHVDSFTEQNPVGRGPHWASPMDVAMRSANWSLAVPLFADAGLPASFWAALLANLHVSGLYLERHLEWHPVYRGNHFVANAVGLVYLGTLFRGSDEGGRWLALGSRHLQREIAYQVGPDGVSFEASLGYHRLVTELFAYGGELLRRNDPGFRSDLFDTQIARMHSFIGAYLQPDGQAPMIGDADDGRLHAVCARSLREPRRHDVGLPTRHAVVTPHAGAYSYPDGGFHILRCGDHHAAIRCGAVGLRGAGSHDHNDQLNLELVVAGRRIIADSGTFAYTRNLSARHAFRSVRAHSVVQVGDEEPNPIDERTPWRILSDRTRARCIRCAAEGEALVFAGEHYGYAHRPSRAVWRREIRFDRGAGKWQIIDEIEGSGPETVSWRVHLVGQPSSAGPLSRSAQDGTTRIEHNGVRFSVDLPSGLDCTLLPGRGSDSYGALVPRAVVLAEGNVTLPVRITCTVQAVEKVE